MSKVVLYWSTHYSSMLDSKIDFSHPLYIGIKLYWQDLLNQFKSHLGNREVYSLGDSLHGQMFLQMLCLEEFADIKFMYHIRQSKQTGFPTPLNVSLYNFSERVDGDMVDRAFRQEWYDDIRGNKRIKYLVFNTGMWWNPVNLIYLKNNSEVHNTDELLDVYRDYFHRDSLLLTRLNDLIHNYNVTVIWRDTSPAGSCTF